MTFSAFEYGKSASPLYKAVKFSLAACQRLRRKQSPDGCWCLGWGSGREGNPVKAVRVLCPEEISVGP